MRILVSGASGLVGKALIAALRAQGHSVGRLVRPGGARSEGDVAWDPLSATIDLAAMEGADAVVHLSGASIADGRFTPARKAVLRSSRIDTTRVLIDAMAKMRRKPRVFLCASAIGYYGDGGDDVLTESSANGTDFLALLVRDWEAEARRAEINGIRVARLRFGVIFSSDGGPLPLMLLPFKFGAGGRLGSGRQWMSWIALEDAVDVACAATEDERFTGAINVVAPNPLRNAEFTRIAATVLHRPGFFVAPAFALRIALGEMADELLLISQRVVPKRLEELEYRFRLPDCESALRTILSRNK